MGQSQVTLADDLKQYLNAGYGPSIATSDFGQLLKLQILLVDQLEAHVSPRAPETYDRKASEPSKPGRAIENTRLTEVRDCSSTDACLRHHRNL